MERGTVKTLNTERGFGFIRQNGVDYFFHRSAMEHDARAFDDLSVGQEVEFDVVERPKGPRAERVRPA